MKKMASIGAVMCLALSACVCARGMGSSHGEDAGEMKQGEGMGLLDGKTFTGTLTSEKDGQTHEESIIFEKGMIRSTACESMGFKAGAYTATKMNGTKKVKGSVVNEKGDRNEIEATIEGEALTGTLTSHMADGTMGETMVLKAKKVKKEVAGEHPRAEHPKKSEHPEHPR